MSALIVDLAADCYDLHVAEGATLRARIRFELPMRSCRLLFEVIDGEAAWDPASLQVSAAGAQMHATHGAPMQTNRSVELDLGDALQTVAPVVIEIRLLPALLRPPWHDNGQLLADEQWLTVAVVVLARDESGLPVRASATLRLRVSEHARYMRYLPGIYHDQRLVARLLALCESFWGPIERQIDVLDCYFDPRYAPAALLRWLGVWVGLDLEGRWPEERQRALIRAAVGLYRKRGTRQGLVEALCLFTDVRHAEVDIGEHFASDAELGASVLGPAFALGFGNIPHTFDVVLRLPPAEGIDDESRATAAVAREREIERIIEIMKPAHTRYRLRIDTTDNHGRQVHHELPATPHQGE